MSSKTNIKEKYNTKKLCIFLAFFIPLTVALIALYSGGSTEKNALPGVNICLMLHMSKWGRLHGTRNRPRVPCSLPIFADINPRSKPGKFFQFFDRQLDRTVAAPACRKNRRESFQ